MLDKFGFELLKILNEYSESGDYIVLEYEDIFSRFKKSQINKEILTNTLNYLVQNEYIKIKFKDDDEICFCTLTKARMIKETDEIRVKSDKQNNKYLILNIIFSSISAFLGAFIAIMFVHFFL